MSAVSYLLGAVRGLWMPLGLCALAAIGVHAAADTVDDRVLVLVERLDGWLDHLFAQSAATAAWVDAVSALERTRVARALALAWELAVDLAVAVPALGWKNRAPAHPSASAFERKPVRALLFRLNRQPTPMRVLRPLAALAFALAGAFAVARMAESSLFEALRGAQAPLEWVEPLARAASVASLVLVMLSLGGRLALRALEHADAACEAAGRTKGRKALTAGLLGTALAVPLAVAAVLDATPLWALFR